MNCIGKNERCLRGRTEIDILFEDSSIFFVNVPFIKDYKYSSIFKKKSLKFKNGTLCLNTCIFFPNLSKVVDCFYKVC